VGPKFSDICAYKKKRRKEDREKKAGGRQMNGHKESHQKLGTLEEIWLLNLILDFWPLEL
jgi:hypothetical protein